MQISFQSSLQFYFVQFYKDIILMQWIYSRAVQLIEFDSHAHLVSKAGSVIGGKSPSPVFKRSSS